MGKYKIRREFFPFSCFTPPISEKFLAMAVPNMKTPRFIYKDRDPVCGAAPQGRHRGGAQ